MGSVTVTGPLFDGRATAALDGMKHAIEDQVSQKGVQDVRVHLGGVLRQNTGRYENAIHVAWEDASAVVTDQWIVYGPWLEGVGSRNSPVTRFPGYHTFRIVTQELNAQSAGIADRAAQPYIEEMR